MIRVFLVDDHTVLRNGIRALLANEEGLEVVGEASDGLGLLEQLPQAAPDVVLMDINMPGMDGVETTRRLRELYPEVRVLALSMLDNEQYVNQMLESGAAGYLLKNAALDEIVFAIRTVAAGRPFFCTELGLSMLRQFTELLYGGGEPTPTRKPNGLSKRELEVLKLIAEGLTNAEIADKLFTSKRTIETHRQNIIEKTQAKNTASLVRYAVSQGLI
jgi:DNA-binding NarL/FixJ family response regulator